MAEEFPTEEQGSSQRGGKLRAATTVPPAPTCREDGEEVLVLKRKAVGRGRQAVVAGLRATPGVTAAAAIRVCVWVCVWGGGAISTQGAGGRLIACAEW